MKIKKPTYLSQFKCIGTKCEDNCCVGWNVDIDQKTYKRYKNLKSNAVSQIVVESLAINPLCDYPIANYAYVKLVNGKCAFLDEDYLCKLQKELGHQGLSNVCSQYPRIINKIDDLYEMTAENSCPEAMRLFLFSKKPLQFEIETIEKLPKLITYSVFTKDSVYSNTAVSNLLEVRDHAISIIQDRSLSLPIRFIKLGLWVNHLQESHQNGKFKKQDIFKVINLDKYLSCFECEKANDYYENLIDELKNSGSIENKRYLKHFNRSEKGYVLLKNDIEMRHYYRAQLFENYDFVFENFFVNFCFRCLFPFTEADNLLDAYILLANQFILINYQLTNEMALGVVLDENELLEYFQSFSKVIGHHNTFQLKSLKMIRSKNWDQIKKLTQII